MHGEIPSMTRHVAAGALAGLVWGVAMRAWMRFITTDPEFSWSGTVFIVGASTIVGALLGCAWRRRRAGGIGWWRFSILGLFLLGAGGAVMWPSVVLGGFAFGRLRSIQTQIAVGLVAVAAQVPVIADNVAQNPMLSGVEPWIAAAWYAPMLAAEAWAFSVAFSPAAEGARRPGMVRRTAFAVPLVVMSALATMMVGRVG
jgi:hypothetical protein